MVPSTVPSTLFSQVTSLFSVSQPPATFQEVFLKDGMVNNIYNTQPTLNNLTLYFNFYKKNNYTCSLINEKYNDRNLTIYYSSYNERKHTHFVFQEYHYTSYVTHKISEQEKISIIKLLILFHKHRKSQIYFHPFTNKYSKRKNILYFLILLSLLLLSGDVETNPGPVCQTPNAICTLPFNSNNSYVQITYEILYKLNLSYFSINNPTPGDGNCFFHGLIDQLNRPDVQFILPSFIINSISSAQNFRQSVINFAESSDLDSIVNLRNQFNISNPNTNIRDYLNMMRNNSEFASHALCQLTAYFINFNINIILETNQIDNPFMTLSGLNVEPNKPILYLVNIDRNGIAPHFQSVRPSNFPLNFNNILPNNLPQSLFNSHQNFPSITNTASSLINNQENFPIIPISNTASSLVNNQENFPSLHMSNVLKRSIKTLNKSEKNKEYYLKNKVHIAEKNKSHMQTTRKNQSEEEKIQNKEKNKSQKQTARKRINEEKIAEYSNIAVKNQSEFNENCLDSELIDNFVGNIWHNKCKNCLAYKFPRESNFCCSNGLVSTDSVPLPKDPPLEYQNLFSQSSVVSNLVAYNNSLALTSMGCNTPQEIIGPQFKIFGKLYHSLGSLFPYSNDIPKFSQIYFYDNETATNFRLQHLPNLNYDTLYLFSELLQKLNTYVQSFKSAMDFQDINENAKIVLLSDKNKIPKNDHSKQYSLPIGSEVAALLNDEEPGNYDIIIQNKDGKLQRIHHLSRFYDPLYYILIFPFGLDGYTLGLKRTNGKNLSIVDFYAFRIMIRDGFNLILKGGRLFQQYLVDIGSKIVNARVKWILDNQNIIKAEKYQGLLDASNSGDLNNVGKNIILPPTLTGSPRWYVEKFQDAMAIVEKIGKPHILLTFTTNPDWIEIQTALFKGQSAYDRPDIMTRVFKLKLDNLLEDIEKNEIFGKCEGFVSTIEQQKRKGLHHAHILIILNENSAPKTTEDIDKFVSAEIPDPNINPKLFNIIKNHNMHGPCGEFNKKSVCMELNNQGKLVCSKDFFEAFCDKTSLTESSYPFYKRRSKINGGRSLIKYINGKECEMDNGYVVPYNSYLSLKYDCHINIEIVSSIMAIKYIYKYITKGPDRCIVKTFSDTANINEVENFLNLKFLGAAESCLKIFKCKIHHRSHAVFKLPCHLPDEQLVYFKSGSEELALQNGPPSTKLTQYFLKNQKDPEARKYLYKDFPSQFIWKKGIWDKRSENFGKTIGRIPTVGLNSKQVELFCLRLLLNNVRGATSFNHLKTINGKMFETFQEACVELGIFHDDSEIDKALSEASTLSFGDHYIEFFGSILEFCKPSNALPIWNKYGPGMCNEIQNLNNISQTESQNYILNKLKTQLSQSGLELSNFNLPEPNFDNDNINSLISSQTIFDKQRLLESSSNAVTKMNEDQLIFYNTVIDSVINKKGKLFCLNAVGGAGKTFCLNALMDYLRSQNFIVLSTAASGVASKLLHNASTVHSRFKVPLTCTRFSRCDFNKNTQTGKLIKMANLIIIDEMTMLSRYIYECIDKSIQDLLEINTLFGGVTVIFSGDWRQCLPIVNNGSDADVLNECLISSYLWKHIEHFKFTRNMRAENQNDNSNYANLLLNLGNGISPNRDEAKFDDDFHKLPNDLFIENNSIENLVSHVFGEINETYKDVNSLSKKAIICPTNLECKKINDYIISLIPEKEIIYKSYDYTNNDNSHLYSPEFLNITETSGIPSHELNLKKFGIIMLLRNLNPLKGHVNGTKYVINNLLPHVIDAISISGTNVGQRIFIPRIDMQAKDHTLPFLLIRKHFPIRHGYAITANKSQGQTLDYVGLYINREFFSHGQAYTACSRVGNEKNIKILYKEENEYHIKNPVIKEVLKST